VTPENFGLVNCQLLTNPLALRCLMKNFGRKWINVNWLRSSWN